jgi:two-component system chemotaxis response regulator CheB
VKPAAAAAAARANPSGPLPPLRLMIVDDSPIARAVLSRMLEPCRDLEVTVMAGTAGEALAALQRDPVDIVLLDVEMPGTSGLQALPDILATGARVLIVSSACEEGAEAAVEALALGAADTLPKPGSGRIAGRFSDELADRLRRIGGREPAGASEPAPVAHGAIALRPAAQSRIGCIAVGGSTGGLHAITAFLRALPAAPAVPILVTQHLPPVFSPFFARQIEAATGRRTRVAQDGLPLRAGEVVLAPGDAHLGLDRQGGRVCVRLDRTPAPSGCLPSVDVMLGSTAALYGAAAVGVMMSGMGRDGLSGAQRIAERGGTMVAQDRSTSAVWGMPGAVAEAGLASFVLPPADLARALAPRLEGSWS